MVTIDDTINYQLTNRAAFQVLQQCISCLCMWRSLPTADSSLSPLQWLRGQTFPCMLFTPILTRFSQDADTAELQSPWLILLGS